jgi:hypothetical protein
MYMSASVCVYMYVYVYVCMYVRGCTRACALIMAMCGCVLRFNGTSGALLYTQIESAGTASVTASAAILAGPSDTITVGGTTGATLLGVPRTGPVDTFVATWTANDALGGPLCSVCVGPTCPTPSPLPNNTAAPADPSGGGGSAGVQPGLPTWAFAIIGVVAGLVLVGIIIAIFILRRRAVASRVRALRLCLSVLACVRVSVCLSVRARACACVCVFVCVRFPWPGLSTYTCS